MSGIVAIMSLDGRPVPPELPRAQLAAIAHRGEWEPRLWEAPGIALGHVNLPRTPEAEREFLPASDCSGRYWITWDGRLDNRAELAGKLGYDVAERVDKTDADYVLDAFVKWRDDCVHHLLGDWAVVIWDNDARSLFCAKDPLGWRQLYCAQNDGLLAVGSEPQQFFANSWLPELPNEEYALRLLAGATQQDGQTCHVGVVELSGGRRRKFRPTTPQPRDDVFYDIPPRSQSPKTVDDAVEGFEFFLTAAVTARIRSNRPVAVMLSGGLDSSTVAHEARMATTGPLSAITAYAPSFPEMDERRYSRLVAGRLALRTVEVDIDKAWPLSKEFLPVDSIDSPSLPPHAPAFRLLSRETREQGVGVTLGGEGGDEWMSGGYFGGFSHCLADAMVRGRRRDVATMMASRLIDERVLVRTAYRQVLPKGAQTLVDRCRKGRTEPSMSIVNHPRSWRMLSDATDTLVWQRKKNARAYWGALRDAEVRSNLAWRDRHLFAEGRVEHRTPFNDLNLVEYMHSVPEWMKQHQGTKWLLRKSLRRRDLPEIAHRSDNGILNGMFERGLAVEKDRVQRAATAVAGLTDVNRSVALNEVERWYTHGNARIRTLWRIIGVGLWLDREAFHAASNAFVALDEPKRGKEVRHIEEDFVRAPVR